MVFYHFYFYASARLTMEMDKSQHGHVVCWLCIIMNADFMEVMRHWDLEGCGASTVFDGESSNSYKGWLPQQPNSKQLNDIQWKPSS